MIMDSDNTKTPTEELQELATICSTEELQEKAASLCSADISELVSLFNAQIHQNPAIYDKALALVSGLEETATLQIVGASFSDLFFSHLLNTILQGQEALQKKLSPLLVGMQPKVFLEILSCATEEQIDVLKKEATTEPLQHHLALITQELSNRLDTSQKELESLYREIQEASLESLDQAFLSSIDKQAEKLFTHSLAPQQLINKALALGWNTSRTDLISKLSFLKERYHKYALHFSSTEELSPHSLNLNKVLTEKLNSAFNNKLTNEDAAIDALADFSLWYIQDYWEIGLLPDILNIDEVLSSESEQPSLRGDLFEAAKTNLEKIGLVTFKDLKEAHIYSKRALKEFISSKQHLIQK